LKTVLIHAYECAPYHRPGSTIGAQRPYQFAKHLPKFDWRAIVLCCDFSRRYTLDSRGDWKEVIRVRVQDALEGWDGRNSLIIHLPSLQHADGIDRMWFDTVIIDPINGVFAPKPGVWTGIKRKMSTFLKLFRGDHSQSWQPVAIYASEVLVEKSMKIDAQIAEHGPDAGIYIASKIHAKFRIPWLIDFRDPVLSGKGKFISFVLKLHLKRASQTCQAIINVTPPWVELDKRLFSGIPCHCITNGYDEEEFIDLPEAVISNHLHLYYFGGIKSKQSFKLLFRALNLLSQEHSHVFENIKFGYNGPGKSKVISEKEKYCPVLNAEIGSSIERKAAFSKAAQSDLLILLSKKENDTYFSKGFYPGKAFEYLGLKKPILVIPSDHGLLDALVEQTKTGKSFNNVKDLAEYILKAIEKKQNHLPLLNLKEIEIQKYSRAEQTKRLTGIMDELVGS